MIPITGLSQATPPEFLQGWGKDDDIVISIHSEYQALTKPL
jgi:hypothetical protein